MKNTDLSIHSIDRSKATTTICDKLRVDDPLHCVYSDDQLIAAAAAAAPDAAGVPPEVC